MMTQLTQETSVAQTQTTPAAQTRTNDGVFTRQVAGVILMAIGIGWIGGNFVPSGMPNGVTAINEAIHFLPALLLLLFAVRLFHASVEHVPARGPVIGITVLAALVIVTCIVMGALGFINPDPNSVGAHNLNDWTPVIIANAGTFLWLSTFVFGRRGR
jgi:hypothetical protein